MKVISTKVNDFNVSFHEGEARNVKVYVDGELMESTQHTWFFHALLEEAARLKEENSELKKRLK